MTAPPSPQRPAETQALADVEALSYTVSHDLRSPLGAILNFSELLREEYADKLGEEGSGWITRIERNAQHAVAMMDSLLQYARIGRAPFRPTRVDLEELLRGVLASEFSETERARVSLSSESIPPVAADRDLIAQLLNALITNTLSFADPSAACEITLSGIADKGRVAVAIADDGPGFDTSAPEKAFGLFQRFHPDRTRGGLGTGLATVKRIVERHGGSVELQTRPGGGTTIRFDLPCFEEPAE